MSAPKPRKQRRLTITGHRAGIARDTKGPGAIARQVKRYLHLQRNQKRTVGFRYILTETKPEDRAIPMNGRWYVGQTDPIPYRGPRPTQKPKEKK